MSRTWSATGGAGTHSVAMTLRRSVAIAEGTRLRSPTTAVVITRSTYLTGAAAQCTEPGEDASAQVNVGLPLQATAVLVRNR
ncbi:Uncharacterised protein [Mycobacteroides abscessus subsp. abscessus]|nr:Uncharacterised protein [Mycobacteroides abscessus subsp. abscessus]